jgi:hypothetical protein
MGGPAPVFAAEGIGFVPKVDAMEPHFLEEEMD